MSYLLNISSKLIKLVIIVLQFTIITGGLICLSYSAVALAETKDVTKDIANIKISDDMQITDCEQRGLSNKILFIESRYCPHCKNVIKILKPLISTYKLTDKYRKMDIIKRADRRELTQLQFTIPYTPVVIIDCYAYVGEKNKVQYEQYLQEFVSKQSKTITKQ